MVETKKRFSDLYELSEIKIGQEPFGIVYRGKRNLDNEPVGIKVIDISYLEVGEFSSLSAEINKLREVAGHHRIRKLYDNFLDEDEKKCYVVMQLTNGGDVGQHILKHASERQTSDHGEAFFMFIFYQIVDIIRHCHVNKILLKDIKLENFLIHDGKVLLADFGLTSLMKRFFSHIGSQTETKNYSAPKDENEDSDSKRDIFALG